MSSGFSVPSPNAPADIFDDTDLDGLVTQAELLELGSSGRLLDEASTDAITNNIGNAIVFVNGLAIEFDVVERPVLVNLHYAILLPTVQASFVYGHISDEANVIKSTAVISSIAGYQLSLNVYERITTPGTYTRKAGINRAGNAGGLLQVGAGAGYISRIWAVEQ